MRTSHTLSEQLLIGFKCIQYGFSLFKKHPILIIPALTAFTINSAISIYYTEIFNWEDIPGNTASVLIFLIILSYCLVLSFCNFILLEQIRYIETKNKPKLHTTINRVVANTIITLPITIFWALLDLLLRIIKALQQNGSDEINEIDLDEFSFEKLAKILNKPQDLNFITLGIDAIQSGLRMIIFFIQPAIAWESENTINALKKGMACIKANIGEFTIGLLASEFMFFTLTLPIGIIFAISEANITHFSETIWLIVTIYTLFASSLYIFIQQTFAASLYLWNLNWLKAAQRAYKNNQQIPKLKDIKKPSLLDGINDFNLY
ncbi:hypothetical protein IJX73_06250 [bacterium]|nr:hypothetical protein [bacterium]